MSAACRRFRAAFAPGSRHPHRRQCPRCAAYAAALERAAGLRLPLPDALAERLRAIPPAGGSTAPPALPAPVPPLPLPAGLRDRLVALPRQAVGTRPMRSPRSPRSPRSARLPAWVLKPRYAVAASYAAAVLLTAAFDGPGDLGDRGRQLAREVGRTVERAEAAGRERLAALEEAAAVRYRETRQEVAATVEQSVERLGDRLPAIPAIPAGLAPSAAPDPEEDDAPRPARGRERRP